MSKKNHRRISVLVSSQTLYHLEQMAQFCECKDLGRVIDKLVREKQVSLREGVRNNGASEYSYRGQNR
jgi:hypothetical protein